MVTNTPRSSSGQFMSWNEVTSQQRNEGRLEALIASAIIAGLTIAFIQIKKRWF